MNILLGVTGSVAATLTPRLAHELTMLGEVQIIATKASLYFWRPGEVSCRIWQDDQEWVGVDYTKDQPIPHIELRRWADILLIAPLTANTLAKLGNGLADNLLTCAARAWDRDKPFIIAPAMNTFMWRHPASAEQVANLKRWFGDKLTLIEPIEKRLACGDTGIGAMARIETIIEAVRRQT